MNTMTSASLELRTLRLEDLSRIVAIEKAVYDDPWSERLLQESLTASMTHTLGYFDQSGNCAAYSIYQVIYTEGHLLNLAVAPDRQKQGVGSKLLDDILKDSGRRGAFSFYLEVRPSNQAARRLYEKKGFRSLLIREKYYSNGEDAIIMVNDLL